MPLEPPRPPHLGLSSIFNFLAGVKQLVAISGVESTSAQCCPCGLLGHHSRGLVEGLEAGRTQGMRLVALEVDV